MGYLLFLGTWSHLWSLWRPWNLRKFNKSASYLDILPNIDSNGRQHFTTNVMILTLQSSTFLFYVVIYHLHLFMECISPSWFDMQELVLRVRNFHIGIVPGAQYSTQYSAVWSRWTSQWESQISVYHVLTSNNQICPYCPQLPLIKRF
jgi:hypothetical protein